MNIADVTTFYRVLSPEEGTGEVRRCTEWWRWPSMLMRSQLCLISHLQSQYLPEMVLSGFSGKNAEISFKSKPQALV